VRLEERTQLATQKVDGIKDSIHQTAYEHALLQLKQKALEAELDKLHEELDLAPSRHGDLIETCRDGKVWSLDAHGTPGPQIGGKTRKRCDRKRRP